MGHLEHEALSEAWILFKETNNLSHRNRLVLHYTSLVRYVAAKVGGGLPSMVDRDDLISYGMFGLLDAIEKFDLDKGVKFETYAVSRIRGAIIDEIRALDWVPRSIRSKARDLARDRSELESVLGRPARHDELAEHMGLSLESYWVLHAQAVVLPVGTIDGYENGGHENDGFGYASQVLDLSANLEETSQTHEIVNLVGEAVSAMDERSRTILVLYYLQEMTLAEIGRILGVTESRVCQLQSKVLQALGESLGQGGLVAA